MGGVIVHDGQLGFTGPYTLEWAILARGAAEAREFLRERMETTEDDIERQLLFEMSQTLAIVPSDREEIYGRAYGLIKEAGQGMREELIKIGYPLDEMEILDEAFIQGFLNTGIGRDDAERDYIGAARLFYTCGRLVANVLVSIFPEDENEPKPDFAEVMSSFRAGVMEEPR